MSELRERPFDVGQVVLRLEGGSPMHVTNVWEHPPKSGLFEVLCSWPDENGAAVHRTFAATALRGAS